MGRKTLIFGDIEKKHTRFLLAKKTINTLLVTCVLIVELNRYA